VSELPVDPAVNSGREVDQDIRKKNQERLSGQIKGLRGKSTWFYWLMTWILTAAAFALAIVAYFMNRREVQGDTATLQLVITLLSMLTTIAATIAITRALSRPGPTFAQRAEICRMSATRMRNDIADLLIPLERAINSSDANVRDAFLTELRDDIVRVEMAAYEDVDQWFILEQACTEANTSLGDHLAGYANDRKARADLLLVTHKDLEGADTATTLLVSRTLYGDDYVEKWVAKQRAPS
jgi:hypothetical protein